MLDRLDFLCHLPGVYPQDTEHIAPRTPSYPSQHSVQQHNLYKEKNNHVQNLVETVKAIPITENRVH